MKKMNEAEKRVVPLKNYLILFLIFAVTIALTFYINEWIKTYNINKLAVSPLTGKVSEVNLDELNMALNETGETILYVSYVNDSKVYDSEIRLLKSLKKKNKLANMIYFNATEYLENDEYLTILKNKFKNISNEIKKAPLFIYINNGKAVEVINSDGRMVDDSDFTQLMEIYEIEDQAN